VADVEKEIARCVNDICQMTEMKETRRQANFLRAQHNALLHEYTRELEASGRIRNDVCWEWITTGECLRENVRLLFCTCSTQ